MSHRFAAVLLIAGLALAGCGGSSSDSIRPTDPTSGNGNPGGSSAVGVFHPRFVPLSGVLPYPTDLYFNGTTDGTVNGPVTLFLPNAATINALDGFSTVASSTVRFSAPIDPATISGDTVKMIRVRVNNANKAPVIPDLVRELRATFRAHGLDGEVILVDDGSTDGTGDLAEAEAADWPCFRVLRHGVNLGKTEAILSAAEATDRSVIIVFDADTGRFKRMWGAFGNAPSDAAPDPADPDAGPGAR